MAIKSDREVYKTEIRFTCDASGVAGEMLKFKGTQPTGAGVGQGINASAPVATPIGTGTPASGTRFAGVLMGDVVSIDVTKQHRNFQQPMTQLIGENVCLLTEGKLWTNMISGTPAAGDPAYVQGAGKVGPTQQNSLPQVGRFLTSKDSAGYALVDYNVQ